MKTFKPFKTWLLGYVLSYCLDFIIFLDIDNQNLQAEQPVKAKIAATQYLMDSTTPPTRIKLGPTV